MRRFFLSGILSCSFFFLNAGTPYGAEITYAKTFGFTYHFKLTVYIFNTTDGWDSLLLYYGDGTQDMVMKSNEVLIDSTLTSKLDFEGQHTYAAEGTYVIFCTINRPPDVLNINGGNSVNELLYIEDTLFIRDSELFPFDYAPIFSHNQTEINYDGTSLTHNSELSDTEADSITYELVIPRKGNIYPVANYVFPNEIAGSYGESFVINDSGLIIWTSPVFTGKYSVAIKATIWKYGVRMGTVIRDMLIVVDEINSVNEIKISTSIFPNPASSIIELQVPFTHPTTITVFNLFGEKVREEKARDAHIRIDISELPSSMYMLEADGIFAGKFVKK